MSIKLIAVDMDGTFLSDQKTYNRERFMAQYQQMKAQGIDFFQILIEADLPANSTDAYLYFDNVKLLYQ